MDENDAEWEMELPTEAEMKIIRAKRERNDKISLTMGEYLLKGYKMLNSNCNTCDTILMEDKRGNLYCIACSEIDCTESAKDDPTLSEMAARRKAQESQFANNNAAAATSSKRDLETEENGGMSGRFGFPTTGTTQSTPSMAKNVRQGALLTSSSSTSRPCLPSLGGATAALREDRRLQAPQQQTPSEQQDKPTEDANMYDVALESPDTSAEQTPPAFSMTQQELILRDKIDWACRLIKNSKNTQRCIELSNLIKSCAESLAAIQALSKINAVTRPKEC